jgi:uncharacterized membrane protein YecN with MAPEG domain
MITGFYTGLLGFWLVFLIFSVVRNRLHHKVGLGHGGSKELMKSIRIHGNFIEIVPFILIIMFLLEVQGYQNWVIHVFGVLLVLSRLLHWQGLGKSTGISKGRQYGTVLSVILMFVGSLFLCLNYLMSL